MAREAGALILEIIDWHRLGSIGRSASET